ncbi:MAG: hypothetical protein JW779_02015 [Candidatus Thorarchaeota archaeon]|nr:hypothetical protein [Candidatus Thorarchaeota archaeon]
MERRTLIRARNLIMITICFILVISTVTCIPPVTDETGYIFSNTPNIQNQSDMMILSSQTERLSSESVEIPASDYDKTVAIIVENVLYPSVMSAVNQYQQDLNDTGYNTFLYTNTISTAEDLKNLLSTWYDVDDLIGAVLIGRLPYAEFYHPANGGFSASTFICDLFLMDLDGNWVDSEPQDGVYDIHSAVPFESDIFAEIFVGRIDPTCLSWGGSVADNVNTYLARVHNFRTGGAQRTRQALAYIDDDWAGYWGSRWADDLELLYDTVNLIQDPTTATNADDWRTNRILQNYQWGHLCAHSSPTLHAFGAGGTGTEGTVSSAQIHAAPPSFNFYNLFCCSGAKWTTADNLAVTYAFSGSSSLAAIGSSKTGSMMDCDEFYGPLAENATLGESLVEWFSQALTSSSSAGSLFLEWYYGMNIVGDPMLTTYYDCTVLTPEIYSPTHPEEGDWYSNPQPVFNWTAPPEVNSISGYYYVIDASPTTIPDPENAEYTSEDGLILSENLTSGIWYLHVIAKDSVGNIGDDVSHFRVNIDRVAPTVSISRPYEDQAIPTSSFYASWIVNDVHSGYSHTVIWVDQDTNIQYNDNGLGFMLEGLTEGSHIINITVYDEAMNNYSTQYAFIVDLTNPEVTLTSPFLTVTSLQDVPLVWTVVDEGSGYQFTEIRVDGTLIGNVTSPTEFTLEDLELGTHIVNLTVYDWANRTASIQFQLDIVQSFFEYLVPLAVVGLVGILIIGIYRKRR